MLSFSEKRKIQQSIIEKNSILANNPTFTEKRKAQQEKISLLAQLNINVDAESVTDLSNQSPLEQNEITPIKATEPTPIAVESPLEQNPKPLVAPNGKPSKLNAMQHAQVRTPEFKAWFGDFEQANQPPVIITELAGDEIQGLTPKEVRENTKQFIDDLIANLIAETGTDTLHNTRTDFDIRLTKKGVVHGFQHQGEPTVRAVAGIKGLIENAAKIATMPHEPANENFKSVHTFVAPLKIAGKLYAMKLTAKEEWNGKLTSSPP